MKENVKNIFFNQIKMFSACNFEFERRKKKRERYMCVLDYERLAQLLIWILYSTHSDYESRRKLGKSLLM